MQKISDNVWIFDGESVPFFCFPFPTRMTVILLSDGNLWVHSPIKLTDSLKEKINLLGVVKYLIAPNHLHHLFIEDWQLAYPDSLSFGTSEVIKKRSDLSFSLSLNNNREWPWSSEINQIIVTGSPFMEECVFLHSQSKVLILTDLVENFSSHKLNPWQRILAKLAGILAPNGKTPLDWRLSFMLRKSEARKQIITIINWEPKIIIMSHGEMVKENAQIFMQNSFKWLL